MQEQPHLILTGTAPSSRPRASPSSARGRASSRVDGDDYTVDPAVWLGSRDRSWGIRPVGDAEPAGRPADDPPDGFWWLYVPLRFEDFSIVVIVQEEPDGYRTLNDAVRVWADGRERAAGLARASTSTYSPAPGTRSRCGWT